MTTKDFAKIWRWLDAERRLLGEDGWPKMSNEEGVAHIDKWLQSAVAGQLNVIAAAMAECGELAV